MNIAVFRRSSVPLAIAAAIFVGLPQSLGAQPSAPEEAPAAPAAKAPSGGLKTLAVVSGARYEKLIADVSFLGPYLGRPDAGQMADAMLGMFTGGKAGTALDKTKPWGIIVQTDGSQFYYVAAIPVANADDLLEIAKMHQADIKDAENGTKQLSMPGKPPIFLKTENGVAFLSTAQASLGKLPPNPLEILGKIVDEYDIALALRVTNIPETYRQFAIGAMQAGLQQNMKKLQNESDEEFADRQKMAEAQIGQLTRLINEVDTVKVGWAIDSKDKKTYLDFDYKFLPDSKMAKQMAAYSQPSTNFGGFYQTDAAATAMIATKSDPKLAAEDLAQFENMMRNARQQTEREIDRKVGDPAVQGALKAAAKDAFDAVEATIKEGQIDGAASLNVRPDALTFVAGGHIKEPSKIEDALHKLETAGKTAADFPGIKWNAAKHAGVNFHTITVPIPENEAAARRMLGAEMNVAVGIGPESVYVAVGKDNIDAVNKAIDASAADQTKSKKIPPFAISLSLGPIMEVAASMENGKDKPGLQAMAESLKQAKGRDHVRAHGSVLANGIRYRLEAEEGVLQAIGAAAKMQQQQRAAAN